MTTPYTESPLMIIRIDPSVHTRNKDLTDKMVEYGGTLEWDRDRRLFVHGTLTSGEYDKVAIPSGAVQFHTHPKKCTDEVCAMGVPSIRDLFGYADAVLRGETNIHCIYSKEGTYCILLRPEIRRALRDSRFRGIWRDTAETNLAKYRAKTEITEETYQKFRREWINLARGQGFAISFQPNGAKSSTFRFTLSPRDVAGTATALHSMGTGAQKPAEPSEPSEGEGRSAGHYRVSDPSTYSDYVRSLGQIPDQRVVDAMRQTRTSLARELGVPTNTISQQADATEQQWGNVREFWPREDERADQCLDAIASGNRDDIGRHCQMTPAGPRPFGHQPQAPSAPPEQAVMGLGMPVARQQLTPSAPPAPASVYYADTMPRTQIADGPLVLNEWFLTQMDPMYCPEQAMIDRVVQEQEYLTPRMF